MYTITDAHIIIKNYGSLPVMKAIIAKCHTFISMLATTESILSITVRYMLLILSTITLYVKCNYVKCKLQFDRISTLKVGSITNM